jgi:hypothetical protein
MTIKKDLTASERRRLPMRLRSVWCAVFAAEWHAAFRRCEDQAGFDHEDSFDHAERACTMADRAVYQLRLLETQA